jgi:hypothetical protein
MCTNMRVETLETRVDALIAVSHFSDVIRIDQAGESCSSVQRAGLIGRTRYR